MTKNIKLRALIIVGVIGLSIWGFTPPSQKVKLGLDLKGGVHLVLRVNTDDALKATTDLASERLREALDKASIRYTKLDATLPLESIKRLSKFLSDNGVIARDVSGELAQSYHYDFLSRATGKTPAELGLNQ